MNSTVPARGLAWALVSAAAFGFSGPLGDSMLAAGWSPGATTLVRIAGAALVLLPLAVVLAVRHRPGVASLRTIAVYGVFAVSGAQLCFFYALQHLDVGVALLLEFLAPVLLVGWTWIRTRRPPTPATVLGCAVALVGLVFVVDVFGASRVDVGGVLWGLAAAVCVCVYFVLPAGRDDDGGVPPLLMISGGTVVAYVSGVVAIRRLDTRVASFVGLSEVLFGVLAAWLLVAQVPTPTQLVGGVLILAGIVVIRQAEVRAARPVAAP